MPFSFLFIRNRHIHLFLFSLLVALVFIFPAAASNCSRTCGTSKKLVPYPFGFSDGCKIRLNCINGSAFGIGDDLVRDFTPDNIVVDLPANCNRSIHTIQNLWSRNYAPSLKNGFVLRDCNRSDPNCVRPTEFLEQELGLGNCSRKPDNFSCFLKEGDGQMRYEDLMGSGCRLLIASYSLDSMNLWVSFGNQTVELDWWLEGRCGGAGCAPNAVCTEVTSTTNGFTGYRCRCADGFEGDGFRDGDRCRKVTSTKVIKQAIIGTASGAIVLILACIVFFFIRKSVKRTNDGTNNATAFSLRQRPVKNVEAFLQNYGSLVPKRYRYSKLKKITNSFKDKLGEGGYGSVFKGKLKDGRLVAVKVLNNSKGNGEDFINEVASIGRTYHVNIVTLLGFCYDFEGSKRALIYEFMSNGSLEKFIYSNKSEGAQRTLTCERLFQIAVGIARGLEYLHRGCSTRILHFDIKPHNILLDDEFCPKISDFGLAKLCPKHESIISMEDARGTMGYIAPEVYCRNIGGVSHKSDVYSYGMMVLEMVGGRKNIDGQAENTSEIYFPHWVYNHIALEDSFELIGILEEEGREIARKMVLVGLWCIQTNPTNRPSMSRVVEMLEGSVQGLEMPPKPYLSSP